MAEFTTLALAFAKHHAGAELMFMISAASFLASRHCEQPLVN